AAVPVRRNGAGAGGDRRVARFVHANAEVIGRGCRARHRAEQRAEHSHNDDTGSLDLAHVCTLYRVRPLLSLLSNYRLERRIIFLPPAHATPACFSAATAAGVTPQPGPSGTVSVPLTTSRPVNGSLYMRVNSPSSQA